ncbi:bifunctional diguanylate cyclase/phosphodiesterase [Motiliproteus sediminis]|uniref:bifunctional diguanylate cyclase/phosphodiesterase n=1 Tax=Motiliproteus sediminis TaxID=1468178 RepID=UPI001AEFA0AB|nr:EAL domain-containing protein [Motiliproteus sediminis]
MPLHRKLMLTTLLLFSTLFVLVVSLEVRYSQAHLNQQLNASLNLTADQLTQLLAPPLLRGDLEQAVTAFDNWPLGSPEIVVRLQLGEGMPDRVRAGRVSEFSAPEWFKRWVGPERLVATRSLQRAGGKEATLRLSGNAHEGYQALWRQTYQLTLWFGISLLAAMLMLLYAVRRWTAPLKELQQRTDELAQPRFGHPLEAPDLVELRGLVDSFNAMSERLRALFGRQAEEIETLRRAAYQDRLTGLANRAFFSAEMQQWMAEPGEGGLLFMRLYQLEAIYQTLGFARRDQLLNDTAEQLRALRRVTPSLLVARLSDVEFALLMPGFDPEQVKRVVEELQQRMSATVSPLGDEWGPLFAIGAALRFPGTDEAGLLARADSALQQARQSNLSPVRFLSDLQQPPAIGRGEWRNLLQQAIEERRIRFQLQPVMRMSGKIRGLELLSEIEFDGGSYPAALFMPFVEQFQLGAALDRYVLEQIAPHVSRHQVPVMVNLSEHAIGDVGFVSWLSGWLEANTPLRRWIGFEVPEAALISNPGGLAACAALFRRLDLCFGVDRIGRHLEQLRELVELGPDYLKIDRSLVLCSPEEDKGFVRSLARMAHDLDIDLITLRIEDQADLDGLHERSMDGYQGYIRKPIRWNPGRNGKSV